MISVPALAFEAMSIVPRSNPTRSRMLTQSQSVSSARLIRVEARTAIANLQLNRSRMPQQLHLKPLNAAVLHRVAQRFLQHTEQAQRNIRRPAARNGAVLEVDGESAGINRSEVGDERALRERSNEPLGPEFGVVVVARQPTKHKTGV